MPLSIQHRVIASLLICLLWLAYGVAPASAAGPLYSVPTQPPEPSESVGFTNELNHRVKHVPSQLNPPAVQSPADVESRIRVLEQGVPIPDPRSRGPQRQDGQPASRAGTDPELPP